MRFISVLATGLLAGTLSASGPGPGSPAARQVALHIPNETAPPGGVVQMKFMVTEPTPISSGKPIVHYDDVMFDSVLGIEVFVPTGDVNGVAMIRGSQIALMYTTTAGAQGTDYPIMTMALHIRPDAFPGMQTQFTLDPSSTWVLGLLGVASYKPTPPATITVAGSVSITNVVPGGGLLPAGTVVSIQGMGFQPKTQVQLNNIRFSSIHVVSPGEIQFTLAAATQMTGQKIQVVNPDGSQDSYFSYMRGVPVGSSNRPLLASALPIFSAVTHSWAVFGPMAAAASTQFTGLAVQNPNLTPTDVTVALYSPANVLLGSSTLSVPAGNRLMRETSELAQGVIPPIGSYVVVTSSQPVQAFGFWGDDGSGTVTPFTAIAARP
jgi:IPT/TIG domain